MTFYNGCLEGAAVSIVEMLYNTNIIAVVGKTEKASFDPRRLTIWDTNNQVSRMNFTLEENITFAKMNKNRYLFSVKE